MTEQELKACPFCGGEAEYIQVMNHAGKIQCTKCAGQSGIFQDAGNVWNTRTTQPQSAVDDAGLRDKIAFAIATGGWDDRKKRVDDVQHSDYAKADSILEYLKPHLQAPVSLEKCAIAASQWLNGIRYEKPQWETIAAKSQAGYKDQAKLMLEAIGVKYE